MFHNMIQCFSHILCTCSLKELLAPVFSHRLLSNFPFIYSHIITIFNIAHLSLNLTVATNFCYSDIPEYTAYSIYMFSFCFHS